MTELKACNKKRRRTSLAHRWTDAQLLELIKLVVDATKVNPETFEKPTAQKFYAKIVESSRHLKAIDFIAMRNKMRYCKVLYMEAARWQSQTGAGLLAEGAEETVAECMQKLCPHWNLFHELFGQRKSINPPVLGESTGLSPFCDVVDCADEWAVEDKSGNCTPKPSGSDSGLNFRNFKKSLKARRGEPSKTYKQPSSISVLARIQEKRIELETEKFQWKKEKQSLEIELKRIELQQDLDAKIEFKKLDLQHELELKKLEMEKEERLAMAKIKMDAETAERLRKVEVELELQIKRNL